MIVLNVFSELSLYGITLSNWGTYFKLLGTGEPVKVPTQENVKKMIQMEKTGDKRINRFEWSDNIMSCVTISPMSFKVCHSCCCQSKLAVVGPGTITSFSVHAEFRVLSQSITFQRLFSLDYSGVKTVSWHYKCYQCQDGLPTCVEIWH